MSTNVNYVNFILNLPVTTEIGNCWMILPDSFGAGYLFDRQMEGRGMLMGLNGGYLGLYKCIYICIYIYTCIHVCLDMMLMGKSCILYMSWVM